LAKRKVRHQTSARADALLLLTAALWGLAFVAQRVGMEHVGPFTFNAIRFALGALAIAPILLLIKTKTHSGKKRRSSGGKGRLLKGGLLAGSFLFLGASFQQVGIVYTTAGNAGFITGLYVVFVPVIGIFIGQRTNFGTWMGVALAAVGLYLLSVTESFSISQGDLLVLISAFFWAGHVLLIGKLSPRTDSSRLAIIQYLACAILSLIMAIAIETITIEGIANAAIPILYGGLVSVGIAYTLQIVAQKKARPAHASILLSLEAVFAALGGWLILEEVMPTRGIVGCGLMLAGMLVSQLWSFRTRRRPRRKPTPA